MSKITIVTAFFNIKRGDWNSLSRSTEKYFQYFEHWARIRNDVIVYVESEEDAKKIKDIRRKFDLEDKTIVNVTGNYIDIDRNLYDCIYKAANNNVQKNFRLDPENPESWNADYNYVTSLEAWCVQDAVNRGQARGMIAWLDFGFGHGEETYKKSEDFDFLWEYEFPEKINIFNIKDLDDKPIFDIVRSMDIYIMTPIFIAPDFLWGDLWELMRNAMISMGNCGLVDDDQTVMLLAYRLNPQLFNVIKSYWFLPLKEFGGTHLTLSETYQKCLNQKVPLIKKNVRKTFKTIKILRYSIKELEYLCKLDL